MFPYFHKHLGAQTRKTRRVFRVNDHLEEFSEFFEYATNIGEVSHSMRIRTIRSFNLLKNWMFSTKMLVVPVPL